MDQLYTGQTLSADAIEIHNTKSSFPKAYIYLGLLKNPRLPKNLHVTRPPASTAPYVLKQFQNNTAITYLLPYTLNGEFGQS
jgi:hypothetical protein